MVGYTAPYKYEPRAGWRETLEKWMVTPPRNADSWQHMISRYWSWRTVHGLSLREAWKALRMEPATAKLALDPTSSDNGRIPPELFSRLLARSQATDIKPGDNIDPVIITKAVPPELPDVAEDGYTPANSDQPRDIYQPRARWQLKLLTAPGNNTGWLAELYLYWQMRTKGGMSVDKAWSKLKMSRNNAGIAIHRNNADRGAVPPELIGRVVVRARVNQVDPKGILLYAEPRI